MKETKQETKTEEKAKTEQETKTESALSTNDEAAGLAELKDLLQRTQANFENYRKQSEKRIEEIRSSAARSMIVELLPIVDHFALAFKSISSEKSTEFKEKNQEFIQGIELIYSQLNNLLVNHHVHKVESLNKKFDPHFHEALLKVASPEAEGTIMEVFQDGYMLDGKVIRHARVKISAGIYTEKTEDNEDTKETEEVEVKETEKKENNDNKDNN